MDRGTVGSDARGDDSLRVPVLALALATAFTLGVAPAASALITTARYELPSLFDPTTPADVVVVGLGCAARLAR